MSDIRSDVPTMATNTEGRVVPYSSAVAAAMLEELGLGRLDSLYADDNHKNKGKGRGGHAPVQSKGLTGLDRRLVKQNNDKISAWRSFDAGDVGAGESSIAHGDLHRRGQTSQFEKISNGPLPVASGGRDGDTSGQGSSGIVARIEQLRGPADSATRGGHPAAGRGRPATATLAIDQIALARQLQREFGSSGGKRGSRRPGPPQNRPTTGQAAPARRVNPSTARPAPRQTQPAPRAVVSAPRPAVRLASQEDFMRSVSTGLAASRYNPANAVSTIPEQVAAVPAIPASSSGLENVQAPSAATASPPAPLEPAAPTEPATPTEVAAPWEVPMEVAEIDMDHEHPADPHDPGHSDDGEPIFDSTRARFSVDGHDVGSADIYVERGDDCKMLIIKVDNGDTYVVRGPVIVNVLQEGCVVILFLDNPPPAQMELSTFTESMAEDIHRIVQGARQEPQASAQVQLQDNSEPLIDLPTEAMHPLLQLLLDDFTAEALANINREIGDMNPEEYQAYKDMLNRTFVPGTETSCYAPPGLAPVPRPQNAAAVAAFMDRSSTFGTFTDAERNQFILELTRRLGEQRKEAALDNACQASAVVQSLEAAGEQIDPNGEAVEEAAQSGETVQEVAQTQRLIYDIEELKSQRSNAAAIDPGTIPLVGRLVQPPKPPQQPPQQPPQAQGRPAVVQNAAQNSPRSVSSVLPRPGKQEPSELNESAWMQELRKKKIKAVAKPSTAVEPQPQAPVLESQAQEQSAVNQQGPAPVFETQAQQQNGIHQQALAVQSIPANELPATLAQASPPFAPIGNVDSPAANGIGSAITGPIPGTVIYYSAPAEQETPKPFKSGLENSRYAHDTPQYPPRYANAPPQRQSSAREVKSSDGYNDGKSKEVGRFLPHCTSKNCGFVDPECKYHPHCTNPQCAYSHPKHSILTPCKYQQICMKEGCPFEHGRFCRYKPCQNPTCKWTHFPGQRWGKKSRHSSVFEHGDSESVAGPRESLSHVHLNSGSGSSTPVRGHTTPLVELASDVIAVPKYDEHGKRELDENGQLAIVLVPRSFKIFSERENRFPNNDRAATPSLSPSHRANINSMSRGIKKENKNSYEYDDKD